LVGVGDGTRCADRPQRVRSLIILRSRAVQPARCALALETDIVGVVSEIRFVPKCRNSSFLRLPWFTAQSHAFGLRKVAFLFQRWILLPMDAFIGLI
jgi:hypothetical protein